MHQQLAALAGGKSKKLLGVEVPAPGEEGDPSFLPGHLGNSSKKRKKTKTKKSVKPKKAAVHTPVAPPPRKTISKSVSGLCCCAQHSVHRLRGGANGLVHSLQVHLLEAEGSCSSQQ